MMKWFHKAAQVKNLNPSIDQALLVDWHSFLVGMFVLIAGRAGATNPATEYLDDLLKRKAKNNRASSVEIAIGLIGLGQYDDALAWLNRAAFEEDDPFAMWFHIFPPLRHLHGHPGFRELLIKLGLPLQRER
jgi:hypothetical protein